MRVIVISPPFDTEYGPSFGAPTYAFTDPMLTIDPPPRVFIEATACCLAACDPGERAVSPDPVAVYDAVAWLLAHEDVVAGLASDLPIASADCAATRLLATLGPSDISFDGLAGETGRLVEAAGEFEDACRGVLTVEG